MRILSAVLSLVLAMALCTNVHAQGEREALVVTIQDIDLTDAQEAKIAEIRKEFRPKVEKAAKALATLVKDELEQMQATLTPEQKEKLRAMKDERGSAGSRACASGSPTSSSST
jgi:Spy/CpxP family protein refolding chaperone